MWRLALRELIVSGITGGQNAQDQLLKREFSFVWFGAFASHQLSMCNTGIQFYVLLIGILFIR